MFLTTRGRYAVMVMVELASEVGKAPVSSQVLASRLGVDSVYLDRILATLRVGKMVNSTRGPGGGYSLVGDSKDIKILDIMTAANESFKMTKCTNEQGTGCLNKNKKVLCNSHHLWMDLEKQITDFLKGRTLASLCGRKGDEIVIGKEVGYELHIPRL